MTSYFPGDRDKESTHSPFSPCTNRVGCVRCWGNFAETNRLALNGLKLWSPVTRVSSVVLEAEGQRRPSTGNGSGYRFLSPEKVILIKPTKTKRQT